MKIAPGNLNDSKEVIDRFIKKFLIVKILK